MQHVRKWSAIARRHVIKALVLPVFLAGCATSGPEGSVVDDPYENVNRKVHEFNKDFDTVLFRPFSQAYGVLPRYLRTRVNNVRANLELPGDIVNDALQAKPEDFGHNLFRFLVNTTVGVFGIFDAAGAWGMERRSTDFGETLFVWGVEEGAYVEVPFFGPYTQRSLTGEVVDLFLNPLTFVGLTPPESYIPPTTYVLEKSDYRYEFSSTVDEVLYDSADSYLQTRQIYLDTRRFELGDTPDDGGVIDPYEELFSE
ncbi:MlaA family lipoprotein [Fluviibacterium sp. S390]|uniref:MlaA family lipoprotein n=1 Tax=Fluviibacterium sp. S390 TaxID=3415139 RepID=UPI003C7C4CA7